jgi:hypothetical protein
MPAKSKKPSGNNPVPDFKTFEDNFLGAQQLLEVAEQQKMGVLALKPTRYLLLKVFGRLMRLQEQIDGLFNGQAFLPNISPVAPANIARFKSFFGAHARVAHLLFRAVEAWCLTCGVRWECNSKTCAAHNCPGRGKRPRKRHSVATN